MVDCKPKNTEVIGPILDGDEVMIGVLVGAGSRNTLGFLSLACPEPQTPDFIPKFSYFVPSGASSFDPANVPRFRIHFLSEDPSGGNNPYVFFTFSGGTSASGCTDGVPTASDLPFPGISVTSYPVAPGFVPPLPRIADPFPKSNVPGARYLSPGEPVPLQLIAVQGETPWFPQILPPVGGKSGKYVLALSNVQYTINAVIDGTPYQDITIPVDVSNAVGPTERPTINCLTTLEKGETVCKKRIYYIIPTRFFESAQGSTRCKNCALSSDAMLGAFCSIGCTLSPGTTDIDFCCSAGASCNGALDCRNVCKFGFTQESDCRDKCFYPYCVKGAQCAGNCKSYCGTGTQVCTLKGMEYQCEELALPLTLVGATGPSRIGLSTTEIVIIATIAVFVIGIFIIVIYLWGTEYNKKTSP